MFSKYLDPKYEWTESELAAYDEIAMAIADAQGAIIAVREEWLAGWKEGREENTRDIAKNFIRMGVPLNQVAQGMKLNIEIVQELAEEVKNEDTGN